MQILSCATILFLGMLYDNVVLTNSCGIMMPVHIPHDLQAYVTLKRWNDLRSIQLQQLAKNKLCNPNLQDNPFACVYRKRKSVVRRGVCTIQPESVTPLCFWKEQSRNGLDGRSSFGIDYVRCQNLTLPPHSTEENRHLPGSLNRAVRKLLLSTNSNLSNETASQVKKVLRNGYHHHARPQARHDLGDTECSFREVVEVKREGFCVRLGRGSNRRFPNLPSYACHSRIHGEIDIGNEDCSFLA